MVVEHVYRRIFRVGICVNIFGERSCLYDNADLSIPKNFLRSLDDFWGKGAGILHDEMHFWQIPVDKLPPHFILNLSQTMGAEAENLAPKAKIVEILYVYTGVAEAGPLRLVVLGKTHTATGVRAFCWGDSDVIHAVIPPFFFSQHDR